MAQGGDAVVFKERIEGERATRQAAVLALRTAHGIDWEHFSERYGSDFADAIKKDLVRLAKIPGGLIDLDARCARLTPKGMRLGNAIWSEIVG